MTEGRRYQISALLKQEVSVSNIARALNCNRATIYRELKRNKKAIGYCPDKSQSVIVDPKKRFGDWEIDTVLGKNGTGSIVTLLERKARFYLIKKVDSKSAKDVTIALLIPFKDHVHMIIADNGREFAYHVEIAEALDTKVYFSHPYSSYFYRDKIVVL